MSKLIVIIGITGNQGGSVANVFLQDPQWKIRGLTRSTASPASQALTAKGIEMVTANLHDPSTLPRAFQGANLIFSVTDFWTPFFTPANHAAAREINKSIGEYAYDLELEQGKNIADAAAKVVDGLDKVGFIASTLSDASKCSQGKYEELWHFSSKADVFPGYLEEKYPKLAAKTSYLQTGYFMTSWKLAPGNYFGKMSDGSYEMKFTTAPNAEAPHLDVNKDTGHFVRALTQLPPGKTAMAAGTWCTWPKWLKTWATLVGNPKVSYKQITVEDFDRAVPGGFGKEIGEMFEYTSDPGYDGGPDAGVLRLADLKKMGLEFPTTSLEEYFKQEDFSQVLAS